MDSAWEFSFRLDKRITVNIKISDDFSGQIIRLSHFSEQSAREKHDLLKFQNSISQ